MDELVVYLIVMCCVLFGTDCELWRSAFRVIAFWAVCLVLGVARYDAFGPMSGWGTFLFIFLFIIYTLYFWLVPLTAAKDRARSDSSG